MTSENNSLQVFENEHFGKVRTVVIDDAIWFVGKDVAEALGYSNSSKAVMVHVDDEDKRFEMLPIADSQNGNVVGLTKTTLINESGLYSLVLSSKLPDAKKFKRWITSDVVPSVRTTGVYMTGNAADRILQDPDFIIQLATQVKERNAQLAAAKEKIALDAPKVEYFDRAVERGDNLSFRDTAKVLGVSQSTLINFLGINHYIYRDQKGRLRPYSQYEQNGLFTVKEFEKETSGYSSVQTLITFKGRDYFSKKISSAKNAQ